jgi:hypothetical protein
MVRIKRDTILGYRVGDEDVCTRCITKDDLDDLAPEDCILDDNDDDAIWCDRHDGPYRIK